MARDRLRVSVRGVANTDRHLSRVELALDDLIGETLRDLEGHALEVMRSHAVGGPLGRIGRNLKIQRDASIRRPGFEVVSTYRDFGFDPLPVTRFGHRRKRIYPDELRRSASVINTRLRRGPEPHPDDPFLQGRQSALRLVDSRTGKVIFRHYVKGYKPKSDWVADARRTLRPLIDEATAELGRKITSSIR